MGCIRWRRSKRVSDGGIKSSGSSIISIISSGSSISISSSSSSRKQLRTSSSSKARRKSGGAQFVNETSERIVIREKNREVWGKQVLAIAARGRGFAPSDLVTGTFMRMEVVWGDRGMPCIPPITIEPEELISASQKFVIRGQDGRLVMERLQEP